VSHALVNNLEVKDRRKVLREALRVTDSCGEIYIFGFDAEDISWIAEIMSEHAYARYRIERVNGTLNFGGGPFAYEKYRLRVEL
jgi:ubiquinone/menaquinone biosynthesis C-methylase UbiE